MPKSRILAAVILGTLVFYVGAFGLALRVGDYRLALDLALVAPLAFAFTWAKGLSERRRKQQAEQVLRDSEERHRLLVEQLPLMIYIDQPDSDATNIYTSPQTLDICGYSQEEWAAAPDLFLQILHPDDRERVLEEHRYFYSSREPLSTTYRIRAKDGREVWVHDEAVLVLDGTGQPLYVQGYWQDVSATRHAERELEEARRRFSQAFEHAAIGMGLVSPEGRWLDANSSLCQLTGYTREELLTKKFQDITHPDDLREDLDLVQKVLAGELQTYSMAKRYLHAKGGAVWVNLSVSLIRSNDGEPLYFISQIEDITERKRAELNLKESEVRYRELFDNANDLIASVDLDERIVAVNKAFVEATGYSRDELLGRELSEICSEGSSDRAAGATKMKLAGGEESSQYLMEIVCKDGLALQLEASTHVVYEDGRPIGTQGILRDVTERERLEEQLRQAQKMEAIGQLAGGIAHDFNNLLTAISGFAEFSLLLAEEEGLDEISENVREIQGAATRAADLTRQLLTFSRQQLRRLEVLDLREVVGQVEVMLSRVIGEQVEMVTAFPESLPPVKADRGQLEQVIFNLAVNARDAMGPSGGRLKITLASDEESVILTVSDEGDGMDEVTEARIFDPFFTTKEVGKGTGLGLSTVYGIVSQAEGRIKVTTAPGAGASFAIYLPIYIGSELGESAESAWVAELSAKSSAGTGPVSSTIR